MKTLVQRALEFEMIRLMPNPLERLKIDRRTVQNYMIKNKLQVYLGFIFRFYLQLDLFQ